MADAWQSLTLDELLPADIATLASDAADILSPFSTAIGTLATLVSTLSAFIIDAVDPFDAIVSALITDINDFVNDLRNTDVFALIQNPKQRSMSSFLSELSISFFDQTDPNRPIFSSGATVGGIVVVAGAQLETNFVDLADKIGQIFSIEEFRRVKRAFDDPPPLASTGSVTAINIGTDQVFDSTQNFGADKLKGEVFTPTTGLDKGRDFIIKTNDATSLTLVGGIGGIAVGDKYRIKIGIGSSPPDWKKAGVSQLLRPLRTAFNSLSAFAKIISLTVKASDAATEFGNALSAKATKLTTLSAALDQLVTDLNALFAGSGFFILRLPAAVGGVDEFLSRIQDASTQPDFGSEGFTAGVTMFAGSAGEYAVLETIFGTP